MSDHVNDENDSEEESFADLFESYDIQRDQDIEVGQKVHGEIIAIGQDTVFVDTGTKTDGIVEKEELLDEDGQLSCHVGDFLELYVVYNDGHEIRLSKALSGVGSTDLLRDAYRNEIPVEGKVKAPCKGGFHVDVMKRRAFCPVSQMDLQYIETPEDYEGQTYQFLITQFEEGGRNIVVSRRKLLEKERKEIYEAFFQELKVGALVEGRVTKMMPYGVFVELIPGIEGMIHISELSWSRVEKPEEVVNPYDPIAVKVIGIEKGKNSDQPRIALSAKQVTRDPWEGVEETFQTGQEVKGRVTRCVPFGAFVEIAPGIEGLVHLSEMSYRKRVVRSEDVVDPGDVVGVIIKDIDAPARRISLSIKDVEGDPWLEVGERYRVGQSIQGSIEKRESFGLFISLEPGITGLLPKSSLERSPDGAKFAKLREGESVPVIIQAIDKKGRKMTLAPGGNSGEADWRAFADKNRTLGSLGEKLKKALDTKKPA